MAFLNIVLRNFALIDFLLFCKKIDRELFLVGEKGLEPSVFPCHAFTVRYLRRWATLPCYGGIWRN